MNAEGAVAVVFLVVLLVMSGAAYSYYLLAQDAKKAEQERQKAGNRTEINDDKR